MGIHLSKITRISVIIIATVFLLSLLGKGIIINKIETTLSQKLPEQIKLTYHDISLNTFGRSLIINEPKIQLTDTSGKTIEGDLSFNEIAFKNFGLIDYLFYDKISLNTLSLSRPKGFISNGFKLKSPLKKTDSNLVKPYDELSLRHFIIDNANIKILDDTKDSLKLSISHFSFKVGGIKITQASPNPELTYEDFEIDSDSIFVKLSPYDRITIGKIAGTNLRTVLSHVKLKNKYKALDLRHHITTERDHYDMTLDTIALEKIDLKLNLTQPNINLRTLDLLQPKLMVFRDRLAADDLSTKPMLSEMIRAIPLAFKIDNFNIKNAYVSYKERVYADNDGGELIFENSNITIQNLTNKDSISPLKINIDSYFYGKSPLKAEWDFNLYNPNDHFTFKGEIDAIDLNEVNKFSTPNLNASMSGELKKLFYTISGNKNASTINLKADYSDIKISILNKTTKQRNKFYSTLANLVVSSNSKTKKSQYKEAQTAVTRDQQKSNINFIFINIKDGLTKILL
jgi:hypothetical protein